ncbi:MAG: glycosyltransferase [Puniceicoccales bacterium]|jgi:glycosyltransferase involved in cell wall biosynthesis|nr:glycosyltransferase [Puniceicoccales bacterium]
MLSELRHPAVTVLVPFFNEGPLLRRALESARGQTLRDIEILCIDDGADDATLAIAVEFAQGDDRVRILHNASNQGINRVRCRGVREARGKFLLSLDGDDALERDIAEVAYGHGQGLDVDVVEFLEYVYRNGMRGIRRAKERIPYGIAHGKPLHHLLRRCIFAGNMRRIFVRSDTYRAALDLIGPEFCNSRIDMCEDLVHFIAIHRMARRAMVIEKIGYHYFCRKGSLCLLDLDSQTISYDVLSERFRDQMRAFRRAFALLHHSQRHLLFPHIAGTNKLLERECDLCKKLLPPENYAALLAPFLDEPDYLGGISSLRSLLSASSPELVPGGSVGVPAGPLPPIAFA